MNSFSVMASMKMISNQRQQFSFPSTIIFYLSKSPTSSYFAFMKLYKTCKYFYIKQKVFFIQDGYHEFNNNKFFCYYSTPKEISFWFSQKLEISQCSKCFPSFQIYRCTIKEFYFYHSTITCRDFLKITKENTIKNFNLINGKIKNLDDGSFVSLDFILQNLPNVEHFSFDNKEISITQKELQNIGKINLWNKFQKFFLDIFYSSNFFDQMPLLNFIQNNASSTFISQIIIDGKNSEKNFEALKACFERGLQNWNDEYQLEIYHKQVPWPVMREKMRKYCAEKEPLKNKIN